jgi:hypothetical protein
MLSHFYNGNTFSAFLDGTVPEGSHLGMVAKVVMKDLAKGSRTLAMYDRSMGKIAKDGIGQESFDFFQGLICTLASNVTA